MIFKPSDSDFGFKRNGVSYIFDHVDDLTIDDPTMNRLTRGANAANEVGLVYTEGIKDPKRWTVTILGLRPELKTALDDVFAGKERVDVFCISRVDGSSKMGRDAILCQRPQQLNVAEGADSMNVALIFETFSATETHKT